MRGEWRLMVQANTVTAIQYLLKIAAQTKKEFPTEVAVLSS